MRRQMISSRWRLSAVLLAGLGLTWCSAAMSRAAEPAAPPATVEQPASEPPVGLEPAVPEATGASEPAAKPNVARPRAAKPKIQVELDPAMMANVEVRHRGKGIRPEEAEAYYAVLAHARDADYRAQQAAAARNLERHAHEFRANPRNARRKYMPFVDIFQHPEQYAGELVTLHGYIRKLDSFPADEDNQHNLKTLYEAWMYTDDSQRNPCVVICSAVPPGIPQGPELAREGVVNGITVTGYFFKMYIYDARDGGRMAPMFLAQRLEWNPPPEPARGPPLIYVFPAVAAVVGLLIFFIWRANRKDRQLQAARHEKNAAFDAEQIQLLASEAEGHPHSDNPS